MTSSWAVLEYDCVREYDCVLEYDGVWEYDFALCDCVHEYDLVSCSWVFGRGGAGIETYTGV